MAGSSWELWIHRDGLMGCDGEPWVIWIYAEQAEGGLEDVGRMVLWRFHHFSSQSCWCLQKLAIVLWCFVHLGFPMFFSSCFQSFERCECHWHCGYKMEQPNPDANPDRTCRSSHYRGLWMYHLSIYLSIGVPKKIETIQVNVDEHYSKILKFSFFLFLPYISIIYLF